MIMIMIMTIVNVEQRPGWAEIVIMWVSPRMYIYNIYSVYIYIYTTFGDGLQHPFMVILARVCYWGYRII